MSTAPAIAAINTLLQVGDGASPETYATVANVSSINGLSMSVKIEDVTSHSTAIPWRQKFPTLLDGGDLSFDLFFIPSDAGQDAFLGYFTGRTNKDFRLQFPDGVPTRWKFSGYVTKFAMQAPVDGVLRVACTITVTGMPDFGA